MNNTLDQFFRWITEPISINSEEYIAYTKGGLAWHNYDLVASSNPIVKKCIKLKQANIGANGWSIHSKMFRSESRNEAIEWQVYNVLESVGIEKLFREYSALLGIYGNAILTFNVDGKPVLHQPGLYKQYYSTLNGQSRKYSLVIDGVEQQGRLGNLQEGIDLFHLKNPDSTYKPWADSPIDVCYDWILFYKHAVEANNMLASRGWVNILAMIPESDRETREYLKKKDDKGKTMSQVLGERLRDWFGGTKNSSKIAILDGMKDIREVGKSNRDMQYIESNKLIAEQIAHTYGFALADLGSGDNLTYNNASTFNYAQYDIVGRSEEKQFEKAINKFVLSRLFSNSKMVNFYDALKNGDLYFKFEEPKDPDEQKNIELHLTVLEKMIGLSDNPEYKTKLINEFRDKLNLDPIDESLLEIAEPEVAQPQPAGNVIEVQASESFAAKSPVQKALESREFQRTDSKGNRKGYLPHWENKINEQLTDYTSNLVKKKSAEDALSTLTQDFPAITKFYKKKDMRKDLLAFAEMGYKEFLNDTKKEKFAEYKVPNYIIDEINQRIEYLLGGTKEYAGIDAETGSQIQTILRDSLELGIDEVVAKITDKIGEISKARASLIADTEVANIVEGSRYSSYLNEGYKWKRWLTVSDSRVRPRHQENERAGIIAIDEVFPNGNMKAGEEPRCRCTVVYGLDKSDIGD